MKLTSKGRAAVTSLVDMSININDGRPVKLSDISNRQNISLNFLEQIFGDGCYSKGSNSKCLTHNLWYELTNHISFFLNSISIEDVKSNKIDMKNKYLMDNLN